MTSTTIIIKHPNLTSPMITVDATSTVELVQHDAGANRWYALLVDGRHYDLVMYKHTIGRPEAMEGVQQALADVQAAITALTTPPTSGKEIAYDPKTRDYKMTYEGALVGWAKTYGDAEKALDKYVYELLRHTAVESADQAADVAELEAETPLTERAITLTSGAAHDLDDKDVLHAYREALQHPEMQSSRWQNALNRAFDHLREDRFVIAINNQGAYCWWSTDGEGGSYVATPATCQCKAFENEQPCKHRAAAIVLSLLPAAEVRGVGSEIDQLYRLVMDDVMRLAA